VLTLWFPSGFLRVLTNDTRQANVLLFGIVGIRAMLADRISHYF